MVGNATRVAAGAMLSLACVLAGAQTPAAAPAASPAAPPPASRAAGDSVTLNFKDADVDSVVGAFGHLLNRTFVIDPRVRGKMTLETPRPVTRAQAWRLLQSALRSQGFAVVETGTLTKIVPEADAKLQSTPVTAGRAPSAAGDQVVTQIFRLNYESATNLVPVLRPLIAPNNTIVAYPSNNSLVVTDYAANLQRIARIIATLDSPSTSGVEVVPIEHAVATDIAVSVARLLEDAARGGPGAQVDPGQRASVMADPRLNAIMIRTSSPAKLNLAKSLIARLDQPSARPGSINVVYLRNAEAVKLAQTLRAVLAGGDGGASSGPLATAQTQPGQLPQGSALQPSPGGMPGQGAAATPLQQSSSAAVTVQAGGAIIAADPSTNSLIITAPEPVYRNLRAVIDKLDARRAQVFIESLILEISAEKAAELGVQWQFLGSPQGSTRVIGGTNLPARGTGSNILDVAANLGTVGTGLNLGVVRGTINVPGVGEILNLGFLARALESGANANILATPNLLTLDNEEARIIIGQNVPFITGQFTATGTGGASVNPFQTIERKDVGTTLRVKPQVSESGTVKLQIFQEVSSVQSTTLSAGIITNRRAIESNVLVDDGQIIVLGGLIEERIEGNEDKVPGLGDVPVVGQLFRYDSRRRVKTNLLVFLRPVIVRDGSDAYGITADRYDYIRGLRGDSALPSHWALPDMKPAPMPAMPAPPAPAPNVPAGQAPQSSRLSPAPEVATQPPAPVSTSRPSTVMQTAPNEVIVPLRPGTTLAPAGAD
ncbi:MAG: type II secretion system protein GspD [Burkholderiales bacterium]|nr:MAG: type II secretion system protein GspD [Burkholderiales bacterium]